jgi:CheY-like chemotaxis protein
MAERDRAALRILVAEDEALAALALDDVLTECGHSVTLAADGEEALRLARAFQFDVLITDLAMPRMTGWELIHSLRVEQPDLPALVMTGYLPPGGRELLFNGAQAPVELLLKPFDIGRLVKLLDQLVPRALVPANGPELAQLMRAAG